MPEYNENKKGTVAVNVRLSQEVDTQVVALIKSGKHTTKSDVLKTALMEYLNRQRIMEQFHENLLDCMDDPKFRSKIREIIKDYLKGL